LAETGDIRVNFAEGQLFIQFLAKAGHPSLKLPVDKRAELDPTPEVPRAFL